MKFFKLILFLFFLIQILNSCAVLYYKYRFEVINNHWQYVNNGVYDSFNYYIYSDTISITFTDRGKFISYGPPYLPIIPVFGKTLDYSNFNLHLWLNCKDSFETKINKIIFIINSNQIFSPVISYAKLEKDSLGKRIFYEMEYNKNIDLMNFKNYKFGFYHLEFKYNLDSLTNLSITFDSIYVNNKFICIEPLRLKTKKVLYLRHEI